MSCHLGPNFSSVLILDFQLFSTVHIPLAQTFESGSPASTSLQGDFRNANSALDRLSTLQQSLLL